MNTPLDLRPASIGDAGDILTVQRAAYVQEAQRYKDPFLPPLTEELDEVRAALTEVSTLVLVARQGHRVVGSGRVTVTDGTGYIGRLAVAPDLHRRGVGGRLLAGLEAGAPGHVSRFELCTGAESESSVGFYERHGYRVFDHRPDAVGTPMVWLEKLADTGTAGVNRRRVSR